MKVLAMRTRIFKENDDLVAFILAHVPKLKNGSILAVTSKIVALAEGRTAELKDKNALIKKESSRAIKTKYVWLTLKDGMAMANAGIDDSNADGKLVLLPKDSFAAARKIRSSLLSYYAKTSKDKQKNKIRKLGVVITDSRVAPLRAGVVGVALGYAGFRGLRDYRGTKDIFGRTLKITQTNVADSLATAATLAMGEGRERRPLAVIEDAPVAFTERINRKELLIPVEDDMYGPLFRRVR